MRETSDIIQACVFLGMIGVILVAFVYPWNMGTRASRICAHLPLALVPLYGAYEATMPPGKDIRIDLFLIWPMLGLAGVCYALKLLLLLAWLQRKPPGASPAPLPDPGGSGPPKSAADQMNEANQKLAHLLPKGDQPNERSC